MPEMPQDGSRTEREWWDLIHSGNKREARQREEELQTHFLVKYEEVGKETMQSLTRIILQGDDSRLAEPLFRNVHPNFLDGPHPEALELLLELGRFYAPVRFTKLPRVEPRIGECYANAVEYMCRHNGLRRVPMVYVEGLAMGGTCPPMLHAWNARSLGSVQAIDWTFYVTSRWTRYFGIPMTQAERIEIEDLVGPTGNLLSRRWYTPPIGKFIRMHRMHQ